MYQAIVKSHAGKLVMDCITPYEAKQVCRFYADCFDDCEWQIVDEYKTIIAHSAKEQTS